MENTKFSWIKLWKVAFRLLNFFLRPHKIVPPNIDDSLTSSDVIVREGSDVMLKCRATGSPPPSIKWKRDDNAKIPIDKELNGEWAFIQ